MKYLGDPASGSYQSKTASRNRFGQYIRTRATPVNPASVAQLAVRSRMASNAAAWRTLSEAQRLGWEALGAQISRNDSLGQTYDLNGFMAYCSVNNNLLAVGDAAVATAPALQTPADLETAVLTLTDAAMSIAYTATPLAAGTRLLVFASPARSAGRSFEGDFRLVAITAAAAASPADVLADYTARLGAPVTGTKIFFRLVTQLAGFQGSPFPIAQVVA